ncbi:hypothetical protein CONCODRAFT_12486 [Conidiobolus coronatus NRRL 28638]|uniref:Galactose oxidase n=1 Tax=Conidiobolus coronatus (strain ATCC 28846 / CBS 209.66 / NRRL 28638) TaxID=796925 RepID=A0A137NSY2_CONC2|nr:hypothetical protein CONCODRAFT_12486 [Conidiobolus coronatus NRRL 28638]|eukprot:KXN65822.1 hypothetical protein CONCODRAFT_12486 [Conidiobolus coronatus NRRL 28638]
MIIIILLNIFCVFADESIYNRIPYSVFKNDKFYIFFTTEIGQEYPTLSVYDLKDGPISHISKTIVNITNTPDGYMPQFLNFGQDFQNGLYSDIWLMEGYYVSYITDNKLNSSKWIAKLVNDNQLSFGSSYIKFPDYINFPKGGFTQSIVNVNNNPVMYIIGGYTYSSQLNSAIITSCVFKYDFNSNSWSDLSEASKSILPPIANHHTVQVNSTLFIINGSSPNTNNTHYPQTYSTKKPIKLNPINKIYKFDLSTGKWAAIPIKTNLDSSLYGDGNMSGASYDSYNGNIITYGNVGNNYSDLGDPHFGTLDLMNFEWRWDEIKSDSGLDNSLDLVSHQTLVIRDQLLLFKSLSNQRNNQDIYVINLKDFKLQSNLDYTGKSNASYGRPVYINVIIGLGVVLGLFATERKNKRKNNNRQIHAVWATSGNGTSSQALGGITTDESHELNIFSLNNIDTLMNPKYNSDALREDLEHITLIGNKLDSKALDSRIPSGVLKDNKFYVFSPAQLGAGSASMVIYPLKDGPVSEIQYTEVNITNAPSGYMPQLLNLNGDLENSVSNQVWMIESYLSSTVATTKFDNSKWMAQFVSDKQLNFGSGFIKPPNYTYFPKGGYTQNFVNINNTPTLYIIGGFTFLKEIDLRVLTSCVFKYDFISNSWSDLSEYSKSILPPIAIHKTVQTDNALFVFSGIIPNTSDTNYPQTSEKILGNKVSTINKTYKLDLLTGKWTAIPIKTNLDSATYGNGDMLGASYDYYNGNIISYGQIDSKNSIDLDPRFGTLDLTSYEWRWSQVKTESGLDNTLRLSFHQTLVIRDQLILFLGYTNQKNSYGPYVIDLKGFTIKSTLDYSEESYTSDNLPVYVKVIIGLGAALGCILLIALIIFYICYRKRKISAKSNKQEIKALWAAPVDGEQRYISEGGNVNLNQANDQMHNIFTLENNDNNDPEIRKSFMPDELNTLTLVRQELQLTNLSNSNTKSST